MGAPSALDQIELIVDCVSTINGQINAVNRIEAQQGNLEFGSENFTLEGGGHSYAREGEESFLARQLDC